MKFSLACITGFYPFYFFSLIIILLAFCLRLSGVIKGFFVKFSSLDFIILTLLMVTGAFFRCKGSWHIDLDANGWTYIKNALTMQLSGSSHVPGYPVLLSFPLMITKDLAVVSGFSLLFSILTIGLVYVLAYLITEDRLSAILSAGLMTSSGLCIQYGGMEYPLTLSVFWVALSFVFFVFWLKSRQKYLWMVTALSFLIAINIKIENFIYFIPFFIVSFSIENRQEQSGLNVWVQVFFITVFFISVVMLFPFIINHHQHLLGNLHWQNRSSATPLYAPQYFFDHFYRFIVVGCHAFPILITIGFFMLENTKKKPLYVGLVLFWLMTSLLNFVFYDDVEAQWNMLQFLVPVFILTGYVVVQVMATCEISLLKPGIVVIILLFGGYSAWGFTLRPKPYSCFNLKQDLPNISPEDCIFSENINLSSFAMSFLFPDKHWIFLDKRTMADSLKSQGCAGKVYYFDPGPYCLRRNIPEWTRSQAFLTQQLTAKFKTKYGGDIMAHQKL